MEFELSTTQRRRCWVLAVRGEIDLATGPAFETELLAITESAPRSIIVDLTETDYIDSTALNALISARRHLEQTDGQICVVSSNRHITTVFRITGLDGIFPNYPTVEIALSAAQAAGSSSRKTPAGVSSNGAPQL